MIHKNWTEIFLQIVRLIFWPKRYSQKIFRNLTSRIVKEKSCNMLRSGNKPKCYQINFLFIFCISSLLPYFIWQLYFANLNFSSARFKKSIVFIIRRTKSTSTIFTWRALFIKILVYQSQPKKYLIQLTTSP